MKSSHNEPLGTFLRTHRIKCGLSQKEVATQLNCTPQYVSNIENERSTVGKTILVKIAKIYALDKSQLASLLVKNYEKKVFDLFELSKE